MNKIKNLVYRALQSPTVVKASHTFWQAFLAALLVTGFKLNTTTLLAAVAAGFSAVKSLVVSQVRS